MQRTAAKTAAAQVRSTTASGSAVYESARAVHEYLQFHYGEPAQVAPFAFAPADALAFLPRTVDAATRLLPADRRGRALDVGCAVGRATFELSRHFDEAVGVDFSQHFVDAANDMRVRGRLEYDALIQGDIFETREAALPVGVRTDRVQFLQGDACNLDESLGQFDAVFASNLLCRLPSPAKFLADVARVVRPGGVLALVSPYSWLEEYTAKDEWIGATVDASGKPVDSFSVVVRHLEPHFELVERKDYPFLIREHHRKYQWGVSDGTFWRRK